MHSLLVCRLVYQCFQIFLWLNFRQSEMLIWVRLKPGCDLIFFLFTHFNIKRDATSTLLCYAKQTLKKPGALCPNANAQSFIFYLVHLWFITAIVCVKYFNDDHSVAWYFSLFTGVLRWNWCHLRKCLFRKHILWELVTAIISLV